MHKYVYDHNIIMIKNILTYLILINLTDFGKLNI